MSSASCPQMTALRHDKTWRLPIQYPRWVDRFINPRRREARIPEEPRVSDSVLIPSHKRPKLDYNSNGTSANSLSGDGQSKTGIDSIKEYVNRPSSNVPDKCGRRQVNRNQHQSDIAASGHTCGNSSSDMAIEGRDPASSRCPNVGKEVTRHFRESNNERRFGFIFRVVMPVPVSCPVR